MEASPLPYKHVDDGHVESAKSVNGGTTDVTIVVADTARVLDHEAEVKLCRKFDFRLLPCLAVMCMPTSLTVTTTIAKLKAHQPAH